MTYPALEHPIGLRAHFGVMNIYSISSCCYLISCSLQKKNIKKQHRPERNPDTSEANWQTLTFHVSPIHVALMHALFNALRRIL